MASVTAMVKHQGHLSGLLRRRSTVKRNVVALLGGLGNQLFQVAFGLWLEQRSGRETWFDVSFRRDLPVDVLEICGLGERLRGRLMKGSRYSPTPDGRLPRLGRLVRVAQGPREIVRDYTSWGPSVVACDRSAWWFGYWQRLTYADILLPELRAALDGRHQKESQTPIGVHVRRGDMLKTRSAVPASWFALALERLAAELGRGTETLPIRVWSDDLEWCRHRLDLNAPFEVASEAPAVEHLAAMSQCAALVTSRSTFSWWAARLAESRGAPVVCPKPWRSDRQELESTIVPAGWVGVETGACPNTTEAVGV
jgi:hypothetical protein